METNGAPSPRVDSSPDNDDAPSDAPARGCPANRAFVERGLRLYGTRMRATAYNTLGLEHPDARDILQDAMVELLQRPEPIVIKDPTDEAKFFCRVVENLALNRIRYNAVRERDDGTTDQLIRNGLNLQPRGVTFSDPGATADVEHILSLLPDADRALLQDICIVGKTPSDVARAAHLSPQTVTYRFERALKAVRALVERLPQPIRDGMSNSLLIFWKTPPLNTLDGRKARQSKPRRRPGA